MDNENHYVTPEMNNEIDQKLNQLHHHVKSNILRLNSEDSEFKSEKSESGFKISSLVIGVKFSLLFVFVAFKVKVKNKNNERLSNCMGFIKNLTLT